MNAPRLRAATCEPRSLRAAPGPSRPPDCDSLLYTLDIPSNDYALATSTTLVAIAAMHVNGHAAT